MEREIKVKIKDIIYLIFIYILLSHNFKMEYFSYKTVLVAIATITIYIVFSKVFVKGNKQIEDRIRRTMISVLLVKFYYEKIEVNYELLDKLNWIYEFIIKYIHNEVASYILTAIIVVIIAVLIIIVCGLILNYLTEGNLKEINKKIRRYIVSLIAFFIPGLITWNLLMGITTTLFVKNTTGLEMFCINYNFGFAGIAALMGIFAIMYLIEYAIDGVIIKTDIENKVKTKVEEKRKVKGKQKEKQEKETSKQIAKLIIQVILIFMILMYIELAFKMVKAEIIQNNYMVIVNTEDFK